MATRNKRPQEADDARKAEALGVDLALTRPQDMGAAMAERYAAIGAQWLADPLPTRLDHDLIERLSRQGFQRDRLGEIRVHRGARAQAAADALDARAFAVGDGDVFFAPGQYDPSTPEGRAVIAHEVAHVAPPVGLSAAGHPAAMPVLNERRRGNDQDGEAEERRARQAEAFVFAQEAQGAAPAMAETANVVEHQPVRTGKPRIDPHLLEAKVMAILKRQRRSEGERSGQF